MIYRTAQVKTYKLTNANEIITSLARRMTSADSSEQSQNQYDNNICDDAYVQLKTVTAVHVISKCQKKSHQSVHCFTIHQRLH